MFQTRLHELTHAIENCTYTSLMRTIDKKKALEQFHQLLIETKEKDGTVYVIGNGGSAGIASHFSIDLLNALKIRSQTLYDSNTLTCVSNDYGYEQVFSYPLGLLLKDIDLLVAISSSGSSQNIINAARLARKKDIPLITLSGFHTNNPLRKLGDLNFWIDQQDYGLVEMAHFFLLHTITDSWNLEKLPTKVDSVSTFVHA